MAQNTTPSAAELVRLINGDCDLSRLAKLLEYCSNPNERVGTTELTALHHAVYTGRSDYTECLLKHPAINVNISDCCGYTPVHLAAKHGHVDILGQLFQSRGHVDVDAQDGIGYTPLGHAIQKGQTACAEMLLQNGANPNFLHRHVGYELHRVPSDSSECFELLIKYGADTEVVNSRGRTALHIAIATGNVQFVEILLRNGCNVNAWTTPKSPSRNKRNGLQLAVIGNEVDIARCLLANGADPNCRDQQGNTPLHHSAAHGSCAILQILLDYGADIHAENDCKYQPLHRACFTGRNPSILTLLLRSGADADAVNNLGDTPLQSLLLHYANITDEEKEQNGDDDYYFDEMCRQQIIAIVNGGGRCTVTTDTADFRSVLKMLPLLTAYPDSVALLLASADTIRIDDLKHPIFILTDEPLRCKLLYAVYNPPSLCHITRRAIRGLLAHSFPMNDAVTMLPIPVPLQNYVLFHWNHKNRHVNN